MVVLVRNLVETNSKKALSQDEYQKKYDSYDKKHKALVATLYDLELEANKKKSQAKYLENFITDLKRRPSVIEEWDEDIWTYLIDRALVNDDGSITFSFRNGQEIKVK